MNKTIGILGGMGPFATIDLFQKIVDHTPAQIDQDHLKILIYNNPKIPPRVQSTNGLSIPSPLPELIKSAITLQNAGADFLIMPCHTAHIWYEEVKKQLSIPFYSIVKNTAKATNELYRKEDNRKILLLATETTIHSGIYQKEFENTPISIVVPNSDEQKVVDNAIKSVKSGNISAHNCFINKLNEIINCYSDNGVSLLLGCCTEIPVMYRYFQTEMEMIDPTLLLAKMAITKTLE